MQALPLSAPVKFFILFETVPWSKRGWSLLHVSTFILFLFGWYKRK